MRTRFSFQASKLAFVTLALGASLGAHAALFGDDEARRAILDLRQKLEATQQSIKTQVQAQGQAQAEEIAVLRRSLFELQHQIEALKADKSKRRVSNEQLTKYPSELQIKQKEAVQPVDSATSKF